MCTPSGADEATARIPISSIPATSSFAFDQRAEPKDAHDLVYCLEHYEGGQDAVYGAFSAAMEGEHGAVIREALGRLAVRFSDPNPDESYLRDGPTAVARFEDHDADVETEPELRDRRILRQRRAADLMKDFLAALDQAVPK